MSKTDTERLEEEMQKLPRIANLWGLLAYVLGHNGIFVTACIVLIGVQIAEKRECDVQILAVLTSNGRILADLTKSVSENDLRDQRSLEDMKPIVTHIESELRDIKSELQKR